MTVDEIITAMARGWDAGDGAAWAANFAEDAAFVDAVGRMQRGREVIATEHQKIFDTIYRGSHLEIWQTDSRPLGDDILLVHTASTLQVPAGPRTGEWHAIQTKIFRNGLIAAFHNTQVVTLAEMTGHNEDLARLSPREWTGKD